MPEILTSRVYSDDEGQILPLPAELGIAVGQELEMERIGDVIRMTLVNEKDAHES